MRERKTIKHRQYTIEEKNEIVINYLTGKSSGYTTLAKQLDVDSSVVRRWVKQYQTFGTTVDRRGIATKETTPNKGRPKQPIKYEDMSKEQLIEELKVYEDIKKQIAYLRNQKKSIK